VDDMSNLPALTQPAPEHLDSMPVDSAPVDALLRDTLPVATPSVFAELVCADPELLRAEFEALIAANYPHPETAAVTAAHRGGRPRPGPSGRARRRRHSPRCRQGARQGRRQDSVTGLP
jgi:hypothetical protein